MKTTQSMKALLLATLLFASLYAIGQRPIILGRATGGALIAHQHHEQIEHHEHVGLIHQQEHSHVSQSQDHGHVYSEEVQLSHSHGAGHQEIQSHGLHEEGHFAAGHGHHSIVEEHEMGHIHELQAEAAAHHLQGGDELSHSHSAQHTSHEVEYPNGAQTHGHEVVDLHHVTHHSHECTHEVHHQVEHHEAAEAHPTEQPCNGAAHEAEQHQSCPHAEAQHPEPVQEVPEKKPSRPFQKPCPHDQEQEDPGYFKHGARDRPPEVVEELDGPLTLVASEIMETTRKAWMVDTLSNTGLDSAMFQARYRPKLEVFEMTPTGNPTPIKVYGGKLSGICNDVNFQYKKFSRAVRQHGKLPTDADGCSAEKRNLIRLIIENALWDNFENAFSNANPISGERTNQMTIVPWIEETDTLSTSRADDTTLTSVTADKEGDFTVLSVEDADLQTLMTDLSISPEVEYIEYQQGGNNMKAAFITGVCGDTDDSPVKVLIDGAPNASPAMSFSKMPDTCIGDDAEPRLRQALFDYIAEGIAYGDFAFTSATKDSGETYAEGEGRKARLIPYIEETGSVEEFLRVDYQSIDEHHVTKVDGTAVPSGVTPVVETVLLLAETGVTSEYVSTITGICDGDSNNVQVRLKITTSPVKTTRTYTNIPSDFCGGDASKKELLIGIIDGLLLGEMDFVGATADPVTTSGWGSSLELDKQDSQYPFITTLTTALSDFSNPEKTYQFKLDEVLPTELETLLSGELFNPQIEIYQLHENSADDHNWGAKITGAGASPGACGSIKFQYTKTGTTYVRQNDPFPATDATCTLDQKKLLIHAIDTLIWSEFATIGASINPTVTFLTTNRIELIPLVENTAASATAITPAESATILHKTLEYVVPTVLDTALQAIIGTGNYQSTQSKQVMPKIEVVKVSDISNANSPVIQGYYATISGICDTDVQTVNLITASVISSRQHSLFPGDSDCLTGVEGTDEEKDALVLLRENLIMYLVETLAIPDTSEAYTFVDSTEKQTEITAVRRGASLVPYVEETGDVQMFTRLDFQGRKFFDITKVGTETPASGSSSLATIEVDYLRTAKHTNDDSTHEYFIKIMNVCSGEDDVVQVAYKTGPKGTTRTHTEISSDFCEEETDDAQRQAKRDLLDRIIQGLALDNMDFYTSTASPIQASGWNSEVIELTSAENPYPEITDLTGALAIDTDTIDKTYVFEYDEIRKGVKDTDIQLTFGPLLLDTDNLPIFTVYKLKTGQDINGNSANEDVAWAAKITNVCGNTDADEVTIRFLKEGTTETREHSLFPTSCSGNDAKLKLLFYLVDIPLWDSFSFVADDEDPTFLGDEVYLHPRLGHLTTSATDDAEAQIEQQEQYVVEKVDLATLQTYLGGLDNAPVVTVNQLKVTAPVTAKYSATIEITCSDGTTKSNQVIHTATGDIIEADITALERCDANSQDEKDFVNYVLESLTFDKFEFFQAANPTGVAEGFGLETTLAPYIEEAGSLKYVSRLETNSRILFEVDSLSGSVPDLDSDLTAFLTTLDTPATVEIANFKNNFISPFVTINNDRKNYSGMKIGTIKYVIQGEVNEVQFLFVNTAKGSKRYKIPLTSLYAPGSNEDSLVKHIIESLAFADFTLTNSGGNKQAEGYGRTLTLTRVNPQRPAITETSVPQTVIGTAIEHRYSVETVKNPELKAFMDGQSWTPRIFAYQTNTNPKVFKGDVRNVQGCGKIFFQYRAGSGAPTIKHKNIPRNANCGRNKRNLISYIIDTMAYDEFEFLDDRTDPSGFDNTLILNPDFDISTDVYTTQTYNDVEAIYDLELKDINVKWYKNLLKSKNKTPLVKIYQQTPPSGSKSKFVAVISGICGDLEVETTFEESNSGPKTRTHTKIQRSKCTGNANQKNAFVKIHDYIIKALSYNNFGLLTTGNHFEAIGHGKKIRLQYHVSTNANAVTIPSSTSNEVSAARVEGSYPFYDTTSATPVFELTEDNKVIMTELATPITTGATREIVFEIQTICPGETVQLVLTEEPKELSFAQTAIPNSCSANEKNFEGLIEFLTYLTVDSYSQYIENDSQSDRNFDVNGAEVEFIGLLPPPAINYKSGVTTIAQNDRDVNEATFVISEIIGNDAYNTLLQGITDTIPLLRVTSSKSQACSGSTNTEQKFLGAIEAIQTDPVQVLNEFKCDSNNVVRTYDQPDSTTNDDIDDMLEFIAKAISFDSDRFVFTTEDLDSDGQLTVGAHGFQVKLQPTSFGVQVVDNLGVNFSNQEQFEETYYVITESDLNGIHQEHVSRRRLRKINEGTGSYFMTPDYTIWTKEYPVSPDYSPLNQFHFTAILKDQSDYNVNIDGFYGKQDGLNIYKRKDLSTADKAAASDTQEQNINELVNLFMSSKVGYEHARVYKNTAFRFEPTAQSVLKYTDNIPNNAHMYNEGRQINEYTIVEAYDGDTDITTGVTNVNGKQVLVKTIYRSKSVNGVTQVFISANAQVGNPNNGGSGKIRFAMYYELGASDNYQRQFFINLVQYKISYMEASIDKTLAVVKAAVFGYNSAQDVEGNNDKEFEGFGYKVVLRPVN